AEDGIRDRTVTGVQTCALPISGKIAVLLGHPSKDGVFGRASEYAIAAADSAVLLGDFDADGAPDASVLVGSSVVSLAGAVLAARDRTSRVEGRAVAGRRWRSRV